MNMTLVSGLVPSKTGARLASKIDQIQTAWQGEVLWITINRPEKKNALSFEMLAELIRLAKIAKSDRKLKAVVIRGCNQVFSAGIDTKALSNPKNAPFAIYQMIKPGINLFQQACLIWKEVPVPVIALIEGYCWGAGMQLALGADFRVAHPDSDLSIKEASLGLIPDMGLSRSVQGLIPRDQLLKLMMSAERITADQALKLGLITQISSSVEGAANLLIDELTLSPKAAVAAVKQMDGHLYSKGALSFEKWTQLKLLVRKFRTKS